MIIYDDNDDECCKERERATSVSTLSILWIWLNLHEQLWWWSRWWWYDGCEKMKKVWIFVKDKRPVACLVRSAANPSVQSGQTIIQHLFQSRETITEHLYEIHWVKSFPTASKTTVTITTTTIIKHQYKIHCVNQIIPNFVENLQEHRPVAALLPHHSDWPTVGWRVEDLGVDVQWSFCKCFLFIQMWSLQVTVTVTVTGPPWADECRTWMMILCRVVDVVL